MQARASTAVAIAAAMSRTTTTLFPNAFRCCFFFFFFFVSLLWLLILVSTYWEEKINHVCVDGELLCGCVRVRICLFVVDIVYALGWIRLIAQFWIRCGEMDIKEFCYGFLREVVS
jgi:hypothetical protein